MCWGAAVVVHIDFTQGAPQGARLRRVGGGAQIKLGPAGEHLAPGGRQHPTIAVVRVLRDHVRRMELAENAAPLRRLEFLAGAEGRQQMMAMTGDRRRGVADQQIGEMAGEKPARRAMDRRHRLLRRDDAIEERPFALADIAIAARPRILRERREQRLAPTARRLAEGEQRIELAPLHALSLRRRVAPLDLALAQHDVGIAIKGQRVGRQAIAAGAADFLIIGFDALRQVGMADEAHVLLVDAHAEGDGRDDDDAVLAQELVLMRRSDLRREPGVVRQRGDAFRAQRLGEFLDPLARGAIDNAGFALVARNHRQNVMGDIALAAHRKTYVRPVEGADENARLRRKKLLHDVGPGRRVRRRGHGDELHLPFARDGSRDLGEIGVFGAEIMAPLRDAMSLVDGQNTGPRRAQQRLRVGADKPLGRHIEQAIAPLPQALLDRGVIARAVDGIQRRRRDAARAQLLHLIAHQGDQR